MKIGLVAAAILMVFTAGVHSVVTRDLKEAVIREVESDVSRAQRMHQSIMRLESLDFANLVSGLSHRPGVVGVFDKVDETAKRQAAFEQCEGLNAHLGSGARKADIVAIIDSAGKVVARDLNVNAMFGEDLQARYPVVGTALKGQANKDIWTFSNRMTRVAVAPITTPEGVIRGALLVGYVLTARDAQLKHDLLGTEVAYFHDGKVHTSSFVSEGTGENAKEDGNRTQALNAVLFQAGDKPGQQTLQRGMPTELFHFTLDGHDYAAVAAPLYGNAFDKTSGVVVLSSVSDRLERVSGVGLKIIGFGVLAILVALGAAVMTAIRFIKPLDKIELGVAEIINGNIDYTFKPVGPDFEGLSNSLNVMMARLLGREEPNEDDVEEEADEAQRWRSEQMLVEEVAASPAGEPINDPATQALAQENEAMYFARVYGEYVAALKSQNKPTAGITVQAFTTKLRLVEGGLKQKWKCRSVRFRVITQGDVVTLKPVPIY
ncbi:MAG TPA: MXAN_5187 C-terminal domain-containing protein [Polyangia bacterium]|nr:MXAN_5187 C-terminal domain-containing protein [Polyangia bacterium]